MFLNSSEDIAKFFKSDKKKYHQTKFYTDQRRKRDILIDQKGKPKGGKWTFDSENRKKYPSKKIPPSVCFPKSDSYYEEAKSYVELNFANNIGELTNHPIYPTTFSLTKVWLHQFFTQRFSEFGAYEDAIVEENSILNHSVLSPMLNTGLITPNEVINESLKYAKINNIPLNSTEGFIRQIIGWRVY